jgi:hypothetical protein
LLSCGLSSCGASSSAELSIEGLIEYRREPERERPLTSDMGRMAFMSNPTAGDAPAELGAALRARFTARPSVSFRRRLPRWCAWYTHSIFRRVQR